jgi:hypothetical protein
MFSGGSLHRTKRVLNSHLDKTWVEERSRHLFRWFAACSDTTAETSTRRSIKQGKRYTFLYYFLVLDTICCSIQHIIRPEDNSKLYSIFYIITRSMKYFFLVQKSTFSASDVMFHLFVKRLKGKFYYERTLPYQPSPLSQFLFHEGKSMPSPLI